MPEPSLTIAYSLYDQLLADDRCPQYREHLRVLLWVVGRMPCHEGIGECGARAVCTGEWAWKMIDDIAVSMAAFVALLRATPGETWAWA